MQGGSDNHFGSDEDDEDENEIENGEDDEDDDEKPMGIEEFKARVMHGGGGPKKK